MLNALISINEITLCQGWLSSTLMGDSWDSVGRWVYHLRM